MEKIAIAAQLYTVREFTRTEKEIAATLKRIKEIGYDCVQLSALGPCRPAFLAEQLEKYGLTVCATHTPFDRIVTDTDAVIAEHKLLGVRYVGLGFNRIGSVAEAQAFLGNILPAAKKIAENGLRFIYHNHQWEFIRMENGQTVMEYLLEHTTPELFGLLPDCYWLQVAGLDPADFLHRQAGRIDVIHLKDLCIDKESGAQRYAEIFEGNMDYRAIFSAAMEAGVRYAAVEQDECYGRDPFVSLMISRENIYKNLGV